MKNPFMIRLASCFILLSILPFTEIYSQNLQFSDSFKEIEFEKRSEKTIAVFSFGTGLLFLTRKESTPSDDFEPKSVYQLLALVTVGKFTGLRLEMGYSNWLRPKFVTYGFDTLTHFTTYDSYGEQTKDVYYIKSDFVWGNFTSKDNFWFYFTAGFGVNFISYGSYPHKHISADYWGWYFRETSYNFPAQTNSGGVVSIGGAIGYRFMKHFGVYADIQFNEAAKSGYSFFGRNAVTYIPIRAGITYSIY